MRTDGFQRLVRTEPELIIAITPIQILSWQCVRSNALPYISHSRSYSENAVYYNLIPGPYRVIAVCCDYPGSASGMRRSGHFSAFSLPNAIRTKSYKRQHVIIRRMHPLKHWGSRISIPTSCSTCWLARKSKDTTAKNHAGSPFMALCTT